MHCSIYKETQQTTRLFSVVKSVQNNLLHQLLELVVELYRKVRKFRENPSDPRFRVECLDTIFIAAPCQLSSWLRSVFFTFFPRTNSLCFCSHYLYYWITTFILHFSVYSGILPVFDYYLHFECVFLGLFRLLTPSAFLSMSGAAWLDHKLFCLISLTDLFRSLES